MRKPKKRGRPRSDDAMMHTAIVLPKNLLDRLRTDGDASGRGLSGEIRRRLQSTYTAGELPQDQKTNDLIERISNLATYVERHYGKWHENKTAKAAFAAGVLYCLTPEAPGRFQSFAERYVIARAPTFKTGNEREEAWRAVLDARGMYRQITEMQRSEEHPDEAQPPERGLEAGAQDVLRQSDDPEIVGRALARQVIAAQRNARETKHEQQSG